MMEYRRIPYTKLDVSKICLGTMTFGEQNTQTEAHEQLNYALEQGVNFIDTAELYPVPPRAETYGNTESIIGNWFAQKKTRSKVILASKVAGPARDVGHIRGKNPLTKKNILQAIEGSLSRLQTDCIDLYQIHWPQRSVNIFGALNFDIEKEQPIFPLHSYSGSLQKLKEQAWEQKPSSLSLWEEEILESMQTMQELMQNGKIQYYGLSNETPWGVMTFLHLAEKYNLPRPVSIQNAYSLLNRTFEIGLAEVAYRSKIGLLAYSPLAFGRLTGKYIQNQPPKARLTLFQRFQRYNSPLAVLASEKYCQLAKKMNLSPTLMALAFVNAQFFVTSNIIGATNLEQLKENLASLSVSLPAEIVAEIEKMHHQFPNPAP